MVNNANTNRSIMPRTSQCRIYDLNAVFGCACADETNLFWLVTSLGPESAPALQSTIVRHDGRLARRQTEPATNRTYLVHAYICSNTMRHTADR